MLKIKPLPAEKRKNTVYNRVHSHNVVTRPIPFWPDYHVSECGKVYSTKRSSSKRQLSPFCNGSGYRKVKLYRNGKSHNMYVHILVAMTWHRLPAPNEQCHHIDRNVANNHANNLVWLTVEEHRDIHGCANF